MTTTHDAGYKKLFSHPRLVADFLRGFVPEDWVQQLDFTTLEKTWFQLRQHQRTIPRW